jgi:anaphase-promoting complex subunit 10
MNNIPLATPVMAHPSQQMDEDVDLGDEQEMEEVDEGEAEALGTHLERLSRATEPLLTFHTEQEQDEAGEEEDDSAPFPPPGLKEISSLASWTVSTAKPGNGVAALRSPDTSLFWQSDGPQPHLLSIHFFKLVSIVHMRIYLDFESDESYTPTKIQFLAGMGVYDIQEFAEMSFEHPTGWIDVDFSNVGPVDEGLEVVERETGVVDWGRRPVLRAFLVQVRILENHQNGKDTHLRAVQLFARDEGYEGRERGFLGREVGRELPVRQAKAGASQKTRNGIKMASWMMDPEVR